MNDEYDRLLGLVEELRVKHPKVFMEYQRAFRAYRIKYRKALLTVHAQFASQPLREAEVENMMELELETEVWNKANDEYQLFTQEMWFLRDEEKLILAKGFDKNKLGGEYDSNR